MPTEFLSKDEVVNNLWLEFENSPLFTKLGNPVAILKENSIVIKREERGLSEILRHIQHELANKRKLYYRSLTQRTHGEWIQEWLWMHSKLFCYVLKSRGCYRSTDVRFGDLGDEDLHRVPSFKLVPDRLAGLASEVSFLLRTNLEDLASICNIMASIHYKFICIHPFYDGNGRIARMIIDQIALAKGLPFAISGYPRTDRVQQKIYHAAIRASAFDHRYSKLANWIYNRIEQKIGRIT